MPLFAYNLNIPAGPNNPSNDQPLMQTNTNSINSIIGVDHFNFGTGNDGLHQQVNLVAEASPALQGNLVLYTTTSNGQFTLFAKNSTQDQPLFTGTAGIVGSNGFSSIYGGFILQWGIVSQAFASGSTTGTVNFVASGNINFPNNCFIVVGSPLVTFASLPSSQGSVNIRQSSLANKTSFDWQFFTNSNQYIGFTWYAIGN